jgi:hypothetical protein
VLIAAVKLGVNFRGIGHELPRVLHVRMREQREVRSLLVSAVRKVLRGAFAIAGGRAEMRLLPRCADRRPDERGFAILFGQSYVLAPYFSSDASPALRTIRGERADPRNSALTLATQCEP